MFGISDALVELSMRRRALVVIVSYVSLACGGRAVIAYLCVVDTFSVGWFCQDGVQCSSYISPVIVSAILHLARIQGHIDPRCRSRPTWRSTPEPHSSVPWHPTKHHQDLWDPGRTNRREIVYPHPERLYLFYGMQCLTCWVL